jgi:hypothetical protein
MFCRAMAALCRYRQDWMGSLELRRNEPAKEFTTLAVKQAQDPVRSDSKERECASPLKFKRALNFSRIRPITKQATDADSFQAAVFLQPNGSIKWPL